MTNIQTTRPVSKEMASERTAKAVRDDLARRFPEHTYEVRFNATRARYFVVVLAEVSA